MIPTKMYDDFYLIFPIWDRKDFDFDFFFLKKLQSHGKVARIKINTFRLKENSEYNNMVPFFITFKWMEY